MGREEETDEGDNRLRIMHYDMLPCVLEYLARIVRSAWFLGTLTAVLVIWRDCGFGMLEMDVYVNALGRRI
jgi:hypothetical protein